MYARAPLSVRTYKGQLANVLKTTINTTDIFVGYDHTSGKIELREKNHAGPVLASFDNSTPARDIVAAFAGLPWRPYAHGLMHAARASHAPSGCRAVVRPSEPQGLAQYTAKFTL